jgi:hypothetical protein
MVDESSKNTPNPLEGEVRAFIKVMGQLAALGTGLNTVLMCHARASISANDLDVAAQCMTAVTEIVRAFDGEEAAVELMNHVTEGVYSPLKEMVEQGVPPEVAAQKLLGDDDDQTN